MRFSRAIIVVIAVAGASCSAPTTPSAATTAAPPAVGASAATLAVSSFDVRFGQFSNGRYWYRPQMVLVETGGMSAATLKSIAFSMPNGDNESLSGPGCFLAKDSDLVLPSHSWDLDAVYYYCLDLGSPANIGGQQVNVTVRFMDEAGRPGTVTGSATVKGS